MKYFNNLLIIISFLIFFTSCKKDYLDRKPLSDLTIDNAIYSDETAIKAVNGAYGLLRQQKIYGDAYLKIIETPSDDITPNEALGNYPLFNKFGYQSTIGEFQNFWLGCYDGAQRCNFAIESIENSTAISAEVKKSALGQAYFLRAYYYWLLTTVYGDVPLYRTVPKSFEEVNKAQSTRSEIYNSIEQDLKFASQNLPEAWAVSEGRVTKYSALAMLGKAYLFQQKWALAKETFGLVISSGKYKFNPKGYSANFNLASENGEESLFEVQNYSGLSVGAGTFFSDGGISGANNGREFLLGVKGLPGSGNLGELVATRNLCNEFEPNDPRLRATLWVQNCDRDTTAKVGQVTRTYCLCNDRISLGPISTQFTYGTLFLEPEFKSKPEANRLLGELFWIKKGIPGSVAPSKGIVNDYGSNIPVIRYADVLLMYAEAAAESNDLGEAIIKLNLVRKRASATLPEFPYTTQYGGHTFKDFTDRQGIVTKWLLSSGVAVAYAANLDDFRKALVHERRVELAAEYHRFNDLVRWSLIPGHPGNGIDVFKNKKNDPFERTSPIDHVNFSTSSRLFPKPLVEVDKGQGTLIQNDPY